VAEQAPLLNRGNTPNLDNTFNRSRRSSANQYGVNQIQQQVEPSGRAMGNTPSEANRVKVLFVLHPMPAPTAAPADKSNP
jgi:hypothetical protein